MPIHKSGVKRECRNNWHKLLLTRLEQLLTTIVKKRIVIVVTINIGYTVRFQRRKKHFDFIFMRR